MIVCLLPKQKKVLVITYKVIETVSKLFHFYVYSLRFAKDIKMAQIRVLNCI